MSSGMYAIILYPGSLPSPPLLLSTLTLSSPSASFSFPTYPPHVFSHIYCISFNIYSSHLIILFLVLWPINTHMCSFISRVHISE